MLIGLTALLVSTVLVEAVALPNSSDIQARFAAAIERSRRAMQKLVATGKAPGVAVAVAVGGEIVWSEGFGLANLEHGINQPPTRRDSASAVSPRR